MSVREVVSGTARDAVRFAAFGVAGLAGSTAGRIVSPKMVVDPYPTYAWLREHHRETPLIDSPFGALSVDHELCNALLRHPRVRSANAMRDELLTQSGPVQRWFFSGPDRAGIVDPIGEGSLIAVDGEAHARLRRLTRTPFSSGSVETLRPRLTALAEELLARARADDAFDLMTAYAGALPVAAICDLLGVPPEDRAPFRRWGADIAADLDALALSHDQRRATRSLREMQAYLVRLLDRKRREPGDDVLSQLMHSKEGGALDDHELLALTSLLVIAGFETTVNLIGNGTAALMAHPDQAALLRDDPSLIPNAVEEFLRYDAPVQLVARVIPQPAPGEASEPLEVAGTTLPTGTLLSVMIGGANRDPAVFADPDRLDVTRPNAKKHLSFGAGPHHCLGAPLARLEAEIAFTVLLRELAELRPAATAQRRTTFVLRGYRSLPLVSRP